MTTKRFVHVAASLLCGWYLVAVPAVKKAGQAVPFSQVVEIRSFDTADECQKFADVLIDKKDGYAHVPGTSVSGLFCYSADDPIMNQIRGVRRMPRHTLSTAATP